MSEIESDGGYDQGYRKCPCFWGREPGSLVKHFLNAVPNLQGRSVLDVGCGEGKNAIAFARRGAKVTAVDVSLWALGNAAHAWSDYRLVNWINADIRTLAIEAEEYDIVVAYGLFHCLANPQQIRDVVSKLQDATRVSGAHIVCCFNARHQDLAAHPGLHPTCLEHKAIVGLYSGWRIDVATDSDLHETHPHNSIPHTHSLTRLIAYRDA